MEIKFELQLITYFISAISAQSFHKLHISTLILTPLIL